MLIISLYISGVIYVTGKVYHSYMNSELYFDNLSREMDNMLFSYPLLFCALIGLGWPYTIVRFSLMGVLFKWDA
jgi:hypothetical protein